MKRASTPTFSKNSSTNLNIKGCKYGKDRYVDHKQNSYIKGNNKNSQMELGGGGGGGGGRIAPLYLIPQQ